MTTTIALAGKGGVGKTTTAALLIRYLAEEHSNAILAIDADPSSNLNMALGLELEWTVGEIRESMLSQVKESLTAGGAAMGTLPGGLSKRDYLDFQVRTSVSEGDRVDLIAMGRSEGPGCYCAVNHNLREVIDSLSKNYRYVVIDNEAGMEHLSRRTTRDVQHLLIISDPSMRGIVAAERIAGFRDELDIHIENAYLVLNRFNGDVPPPLRKRIEGIGIPYLGAVPEDEALAELDISGLPIAEVENDSPAYQAVKKYVGQILAE